jgi:hypothetical protein
MDNTSTPHNGQTSVLRPCVTIRALRGAPRHVSGRGSGQCCGEFGAMFVDVRHIGREDVDVSSGEAPLLDWITGPGAGSDQVHLPALPLNNGLDYPGAEFAAVVIHESAQPARLIR